MNNTDILNERQKNISDSHWTNWRNSLALVHGNHPVQMLQWEATRRCDLKCKHCGSPKENSGVVSELTTEEVKKAFTEISNTLDLSDLRFVTITGGEPLLRHDFFDILSLFHSLGWTSTIQTNGNYLAKYPEKISTLLELGIRGIGIDLDGMKEFHDRLRNKSGHFNQSVKNLNRLLTHKDILYVTTTTVVTAENINCLPELWKIISKINPHRWRLLPLEDMGRAKNSNSTLGPDQLRYVLDFISEKKIENYGKKMVQPELGCVGWIGKKYEGLVRPYIWSCIAGRTCLGILHDGGLSACAHINRAFIQGNVRDGNIAEVWNNNYQPFRQRSKQKICEDCSEKEFCTVPMHKIGSDGKLRGCATKSLCERR